MSGPTASSRYEPGKEHSVERLKSCIQDLKKLATSKVKKSSSHVGTSITNTMGSQQVTRGSDRAYEPKYRSSEVSSKYQQPSKRSSKLDPKEGDKRS